MKKAFTLIELLVVIAIIAILAAILFPVFAQAKVAAKKAVSISNQKQLGLALVMYAGDYDDLYPRQDGCTLNDSLETKWNVQPTGTNPAPWCGGSSSTPGVYAFRDNHYSWGKWVMPYVKTASLFVHPVFAPIFGTTPTAGYLGDGNNDGKSFYDQGEIADGYALNLALTGALNTYGHSAPYSNPGAIRNSFLGGTQTSIPSPAEAMMIVEQPFEVVTSAVEFPPTGPTVTYYPMAIREHWQAMFMQQGGSGFCGDNGVIDPKAAPFAGSVPLSFADGHTKAMPVGQFLANTPTAAQYGIPADSYYCLPSAAYYNSGMSTAPSWTQSWPMWGLQ